MLAQNIYSMVDDFAALDTELKSIDSKIKRHAELKKLLAEYCDSKGDAEMTLSGKHFVVQFSKPVINKTVEDLPDYLEAVGLEGFLKSVKVSTTAASKLLNKTEQERLFVKSRGSRRLKAIMPKEPVSGLDPAFETMLKTILG